METAQKGRDLIKAGTLIGGNTGTSKFGYIYSFIRLSLSWEVEKHLVLSIVFE